MLALSWIAVNATWGLTGPPTLISSWLSLLAPLAVFIALSLSVFAAVGVVAERRGDPDLLLVASMLFAYTAGVVVSEFARETLQPSNTFLDRSFILLPAIPMSIVARLLGSTIPYPFKWGDWSVPSTWLRLGGHDWSASMRGSLVFIALPVALLLQMAVDFEPIRTGELWPWLPTILGLSVLNGFSEDLRCGRQVRRAQF